MSMERMPSFNNVPQEKPEADKNGNKIEATNDNGQEATAAHIERLIEKRRALVEKIGHKKEARHLAAQDVDALKDKKGKMEDWLKNVSVVRETFSGIAANENSALEKSHAA